MKHRYTTLITSLYLLLSCLAAAQTTTYTNPVVTPVAADPDILRAEDGTFYLYATQDNWGDRDRYIPIFTSRDLVTWEYLKDAFTWPPAWKQGGGFLWAPDVSEYEGTYYLYYAASLWGDPDPCIGLATAAHPAGPWQDLGRPLFCSSDVGVRNSIDPFVWEEDGVRTLVWGSFHGIYAVQLGDDGTETVGEAMRIADTRFEAPYIVKRDGFYYLFLSAGSCCEGEWSTYSVYVGRSASFLGPYLDARGRDLNAGGGTLVLDFNEIWVGPGHTALVTDDAGQDWLVYHAIPRDNPRLPNTVNRRPGLIDPVIWVEGWPIINGGDGPSYEPQPAPLIHQD